MTTFDHEMLDELNLLLKFPSDSLLQGLKIHHDASQSTVNAASRLYAKGLITQPDGGPPTPPSAEQLEFASMLLAPTPPPPAGPPPAAPFWRPDLYAGMVGSMPPASALATLRLAA